MTWLYLLIWWAAPAPGAEPEPEVAALQQIRRVGLADATTGIKRDGDR